MEITSAAEFAALSTKALVVNFHADWAPQSVQMNQLIATMAKKFTDVKFVYIEAENIPDLSSQYSIQSVPTVLVIKEGKPIHRIEGYFPVKVGDALKDLSEQIETMPHNLDARLKKVINRAPVMLFMKGNPSEPRCGFSRQIIEILKEHNINFESFDILSDEEVRQGLKTFSNWPTYPQLYVKGELVGGLDIVREMVEAGGFKTMFQ